MNMRGSKRGAVGRCLILEVNHETNHHLSTLASVNHLGQSLRTCVFPVGMTTKPINAVISAQSLMYITMMFSWVPIPS